MQAADFAKTFSTWRFDPCVRTRKKNEATWRNSSSGEVSSVQERIRWMNPNPKKGLRGVRGTQGPKWSLSTLIFDNGEWYLRIFEGGSRGVLLVKRFYECSSLGYQVSGIQRCAMKSRFYSTLSSKWLKREEAPVYGKFNIFNFQTNTDVYERIRAQNSQNSPESCTTNLMTLVIPNKYRKSSHLGVLGVQNCSSDFPRERERGEREDGPQTRWKLKCNSVISGAYFCHNPCHHPPPTFSWGIPDSKWKNLSLGPIM